MSYSAIKLTPTISNFSRWENPTGRTRVSNMTDTVGSNSYFGLLRVA